MSIINGPKMSQISVIIPKNFHRFLMFFGDFHKHLQGLALYPQIASKDLKNNLHVSNCKPQIDKSC